MQYLRRGTVLTLVIVSIVMGILSYFVPAQQTLRPLVRLHIIANSDAAGDQDVKYQIRDAVVTYLSPKLEDVTELSQARKIIAAERVNLENIAMAQLREKNKKYSVQSNYGYYYFPPRTYGAIFVPEGKYEAFRIVLGSGEGRNWWCVLFPPLCFTKGSGWDVTKAGNTGSIEKPIVQVKSKLWEILQTK